MMIQMARLQVGLWCFIYFICCVCWHFEAGQEHMGHVFQGWVYYDGNNMKFPRWLVVLGWVDIANFQRWGMELVGNFNIMDT